MKFERVAVVGAGAWGVALANVLARAGRKVMLCARDRAGAHDLKERRETSRLPGVRLDKSVAVVSMPPDVSQQHAVLLAIPSQRLREATRSLAATLVRGTPAGKFAPE